MRSNLSAAGCRDHLARLLDEESGELARLEVLLDKEHAILAANDVEKLTAAGVERQRCITALFRIEDERRSLCRMLDIETTAAGIEKLLKWCDPSRALQRRWAACTESAQRCRSLNDRNGALVNARLKRVEGLLNVVTSRPAVKGTYGKQAAGAPARTGYVLTTRV